MRSGQHGAGNSVLDIRSRKRNSLGVSEMTEIIIDCPEELTNLYFGKVEKEIPRLVSCREIEARVSELIVKDLEDYNGVSE